MLKDHNLGKLVSIDFGGRGFELFRRSVPSSRSFYISPASKALCLALTGFLLSIGFLNGQHQAWEQAVEAYGQKDYELAQKQWQALVDQGFESPDLYYNLANSYFRLEDIGRAILYYEKALLLAPRNEDIIQNLKIANLNKTDEWSSLPPFFLSRWWSGLRGLFPSNVWMVLSVIFCWLGIWMVWKWITNKIDKSGQKVLVFMLFIAALLTGLLARSARDFQLNHPFGIIVQQEVPLKVAPDAEEDVMLIHAGTKVRYLDQIGDWVKVRLPGGDSGWIADDVSERI